MSDAPDTLVVHLRGLEVFGRHGVFPAEKRLGQRFVIDIDIELAHTGAVTDDDLAATVDYAALADDVAAIVGGPPLDLLEALAGRIADRVLAEPHAAGVVVTVRKPHVALAHVVSEAAVTLTRRRAGA